MLAPILDRIAEKNAGKLTVVKVNVDKNQDVMQKYNIKGIPTLMLFKSGNVVATHVGMATESKLDSFIDENV
jgi:thioredoxin 1